MNREKPNRIYKDMDNSQQKDVQRWIRGDSGNGLKQLAETEYNKIVYNLRKGDIELADKIFNNALDVLEQIDENIGGFLIEYNYKKEGKKRFRERLFYDCFSSRIGKRSINKEFQ